MRAGFAIAHVVGKLKFNFFRYRNVVLSSRETRGLAGFEAWSTLLGSLAGEAVAREIVVALHDARAFA
jgi:hypothetical protein